MWMDCGTPRMDQKWPFFFASKTKSPRAISEALNFMLADRREETSMEDLVAALDAETRESQARLFANGSSIRRDPRCLRARLSSRRLLEAIGE